MVSSINCGTSVLCGFVVFSLLGHMSEILGLDIEDVAKSGNCVMLLCNRKVKQTLLGTARRCAAS